MEIVAVKQGSFFFYCVSIKKMSESSINFSIGPEKTINGSSGYTIHMELREGDLAENRNIWSSRGVAE